MYNELYNVCHLELDWLNELCSHYHDIIIEVTGEELIECEKLITLDKDLKSITAQNPYTTKEYENQMKEILNIDTSEIKDDCHRFGIEMLQKLFNYENQSKPKKKDNEVSTHD